MEIEKKKIYEAPHTTVVEVKTQGMLCGSNPNQGGDEGEASRSTRFFDDDEE